MFNNYELNNHLNLRGNQVIDGRFELMSDGEIALIPLALPEEREAQIGRKVYNITKKQFERYDEIRNAFVPDGSAGGDTRRGKLDWSIETETDDVKKNPPSLANMKAGDYYVVAKSGEYEYVDKDGIVRKQKADMGSTFNVIVAVPATETTEEVLDWQYTESETSKLELVIAYDSTNPDRTEWEFVSYSEDTSAVLYDLWKNAYNSNMYKETTETGPVSGQLIITRTPILDNPEIIEDRDTYNGKTVYRVKVKFNHPLRNPEERYVVVLQ